MMSTPSFSSWRARRNFSLARMLQPEDLGRTLLYIATMPARACINELIISPTWNRFYLGGLEKPKS